MNIPERSWDQDHYDEVTDIIPADIDFNGPASKTLFPALEFDVGNSVELDELYTTAQRLVQSFEDEGVTVDEVRVEAGYRGACNEALLLIVVFAE